LSWFTPKPDKQLLIEFIVVRCVSWVVGPPEAASDDARINQFKAGEQAVIFVVLRSLRLSMLSLCAMTSTMAATCRGLVSPLR